MVDWSYYDKFEELNDRYLPVHGEGETMASQIVTAVNKLVYKWYNDGDVFDNRYHMDGWMNDLSSFANWLYYHTETRPILLNICQCTGDDDYENLLRDLADQLLDAAYLEKMSALPAVDSVYTASGPFRYEEPEDDWDSDEL